MTRVTLSEEDLIFIKDFSNKRYLNQRSCFIKDKKVTPLESSRDIDLHGAIGELAVCRHFNLPFNTELRYNTDFGIDIKYKNKTIDVKTTYYKTGKLLFKSLDAFKADIAILTYINKNNLKEVHILGGITKTRFKEKCKLINLGYIDNLYVAQEDLYKL
jgi:hypothetical protein